MSPAMGGLDAATFAWDHHLYRYIFLSGQAVLLYDYFLMLWAEIPTIWFSKPRPATLWFFVVRYLSLACSATTFLFYFGNLSPDGYFKLFSSNFVRSPIVTTLSCATMQRVLEGLQLTQQSLIELMLILRVVALCGYNPWLMGSMGLISTVAGGLGLWAVIAYASPQILTMPGLTGCHTGCRGLLPFVRQCHPIIRLINLLSLGSAGAWVAELTLNLTIFVLTVYCAHHDRFVIRSVPGSLMERIARDGAMYFGLLILANLANILTLYFGDIILTGILSWWTTSLSMTLICRLMLNLQRAGAWAHQDDFGPMALANIPPV
ncbi:hypothetical protein B0H17DRAFT_1206305 [Mycena rosella]|uniref:DUF6533 domain-containing protein n=1 Tax=Mycena rosella TaxID=1033263 RepID=A0AAD7D5K2_MYCRO|nr:hypothetical protein B0H17DRAFT_1206305 [Mycena rosella]